jgi:hypothetical protein
MPNANLFTSVNQCRLPQAASEPSYWRARRLTTIKPGCELEPEHRPWKVCMEIDSSSSSTIDWIALLLFGVLAIAAIVPCFTQLFHLLVSGSLEHVVQALLPR